MNDNSQSKHLEFEDDEFEIAFKCGIKKNPEKYTKFIKSQSTKDRFSKPMSEIFYPPKENSLNDLANAEIKKFEGFDNPFSPDELEYIKQISNRTLINSVYVFKFINQLLLQNNEKNFSGLTSKIKIDTLSNRIQERWMEHKLSYLRGIIFFTAKINSDMMRTGDLEELVQIALKGNCLIEILIKNIQNLHTKQKILNQEIEIKNALNVLKQKELLMRAIHNLFIQIDIKEDKLKLVKNLMTIFGTNISDGGASELMKVLGFGIQRISQNIESVFERISISSTFLFLAFFMKPFQKMKSNNSEIDDLGQTIEILLSVYETIKNLDLTHSSDQVLFRLFEIVFLSVGHLLKENNPIRSKFKEISYYLGEKKTQVTPIASLDILSKRLKLFFPENNDIHFRSTLRYLLNCVAIIVIKDEKEENPLFENREEINEVFISILKDVVKSSHIFQSFWDDCDDVSYFSLMIKDIFASYPSHTANFVKLISGLLRAGNLESWEKLERRLSSLDSITLKIDENIKKYISQSRDNNGKEERLRVIEDFTPIDFISIKINTECKEISQQNAYEFQHSFNFFDYLFQQVSKMLSVDPSNIHSDEKLMYTLFCRLLEYHPSIASKIQKIILLKLKHENDPKIEETPFFVIRFLCQMAMHFSRNESDLKLQIHTFKALNSLINSDFYEVSVFILKLMPLMKEQSDGVLCYFKSYLEFFLTRSIDPSLKSEEKKYFQGMKAIIGILHGLIVNEKSILEYALSIQSSLDVGESKMELAEVTRQYQRIISEKNDLDSKVDQLKFNEILSRENDFWTQNFLNRGLLIPFSYDDLFKNFILKLCRVFSKEKMMTSNEYLPEYYDHYSEVFSLLKTFLSKLSFTEPRTSIDVRTYDDFKIKMTTKLKEILNLIPFQSLFSEVFLLIEESKDKLQMNPNKKEFFSITNKHLFNFDKNIRLSQYSETLQMFFIKALSCLQSVIDLATDLAKTGEENKYPEFCGWVKSCFNAREGFFKSSVLLQNTKFNTNIIVSLLVLTLNRVDTAVRLKIQDIVDSSRVYLERYSISSSQFDQNEYKIDAMLFFDESLFRTASILNPKNIRKSFFLTSYVFRVLESLLKYWRAFPGNRVPVFLDYFRHPHFDVTDRELLFKAFSEQICKQVKEKNLEVINFLIECNFSQETFIFEFLKCFDGVDTRQNLFFLILKKPFENNNWALAQKNSYQFEESLCNDRISSLSHLVFSFIQNKRLKKIHTDIIWSTLFIDACQLIFVSLSQFNQTFEEIMYFVAFFTEEKKQQSMDELFLSQRSFKYCEIQLFVKEICFLDKTLRLLMKIVLDSLYGVLLGKKDRFTIEFARDFLFKMNQKNINLFEVVASKDLVTIIENSQVLFENFFQKLENISSTEKPTSWNQTNNNFTNQTSFIRINKTEEERAVTNKGLSEKEVFIRQKFRKNRPEFNPIHIYMAMMLEGHQEKLSLNLADHALIGNLLKSLVKSKEKLQGCFFNFSSFVNSVGVRGIFFGTRFCHIPSANEMKEFLNRENSKYKNNSFSQVLDLKHFSMISDSYLEQPMSGDLGNGREITKDLPNIQNTVAQLISPLQFERMSLQFDLFALYTLQNPQFASKNPVHDSLEQVLYKLEELFKLLEFFILTFSSKKMMKQDFISEQSLFGNLLKTLANYFKIAAHFSAYQINPNSDKDIDKDKELSEKSARFCEGVVNINEFIDSSTQLKLDREIGHQFNEVLHNYFHFCSSFRQVSKISNLNLFYWVLKNRLAGNTKKILLILEELFKLAPDILNEQEISSLSEVFFSKNIQGSDFKTLIRIFSENYFNRKKSIDYYVNSQLLENLSKTVYFDSKEDFQKCILYKEDKVSEFHSVFCHMLSFVTNFSVATKNNQISQKKVLLVYFKFQRHIETILTLNLQSQSNSINSINSVTQIFNYAFLEELKHVLCFIRAICMTSEASVFSKSDLINRVYGILVSQTLNMISPNYFCQKVTQKVSHTLFKLGEHFKVHSLFEQELEKVVLIELTVTQMARLPNTLAKSDLENKNSLYSNNQFARDNIHFLTIQGAGGPNLFLFHIEIFLLEVIFLCSDLFRLLTMKTNKSSQKNTILNDQSVTHFCSLSSLFLSAQDYIKNYFIKLSHSEYYRDANLNTLLLKNSVFAFQETGGLFQLGPVYSYQEIKNYVRRAFEMTLLCQRMCFKLADNQFLLSRVDLLNVFKRNQDESIKLVADFSRIQTYGSLTKGSVNKDRKQTQDPLRSLNQAQINYGQNLSVRQIGNDKIYGQVEKDESNHSKIHQEFMEEFKVAYKWNK